jgi:hypothetical protein
MHTYTKSIDRDRYVTAKAEDCTVAVATDVVLIVTGGSFVSEMY